MAGNNLGRDIKGANHPGITSIIQDGSPSYPKNDYLGICEDNK
jgi:hypothetical protein